METDLFRVVATQGVFAALFCYLLFYVLRENSKREGKYQEIISDLTNKFHVLEDVRQDLREMKSKFFK